jgi:hypothetical protein
MHLGEPGALLHWEFGVMTVKLLLYGFKDERYGLEKTEIVESTSAYRDN